MDLFVTGDLTLDQLNLALDYAKSEIIKRMNQIQSPIAFKPREIP